MYNRRSAREWETRCLSIMHEPMIAAQFNNKLRKRNCDVMCRTCDVMTSWARQARFSTLYVTSRYDVMLFNRCTVVTGVIWDKLPTVGVGEDRICSSRGRFNDSHSLSLVGDVKSTTRGRYPVFTKTDCRLFFSYYTRHNSKSIKKHNIITRCNIQNAEACLSSSWRHTFDTRRHNYVYAIYFLIWQRSLAHAWWKDILSPIHALISYCWSPIVDCSL
jgi:hypothetical protein